MKRKLIFALILSISISIDMLSTWLLTESGYKELTGLIKMFLDANYFLLLFWVYIWFIFVYFMHPYLTKKKFNIHLETIIIMYSFVSLLAGIGNFYLYYQYGSLI